MRRSLLLGLTGALVLLIIGVSAGFAGQTRAVTREANDLIHDAAEQAQVLNAYFARARSIILLTAHSSEYRQFYAEPGDRDQRVRRGGPTLDAINGSLGYLEQLYPDRIGEACFIDASGAENARTVRGERATYADLSLEEDKQPFFAPSFALAADQVYQAKPYLSPDTDEWVIANVTPVVMPDRSKPAIVHFEVTVDSFRREAIARSDRSVLVVDADTGQVVINSLRPQQIGAGLGDPADTRFHGLVGGWAATGRMQLDGHQAAYQRIAATPGNANNWYVVSIANNATGTFTGVGVLPFVLVVAALLLIAFLLIALRRGRESLVSAANTDALTGLYNRRRLVADLDTELGRATDIDPVLLMLCDLNGFKAYNDTFGHPAGDALLARLGAALAREIGAKGRAYRIGGDEFCVLARPGRDGIDEIIQVATRALSEQGDGFTITTSQGAILLPTEASSATEAMRVVDLRMYENKNSSRVPADMQTVNALLRAIHERDPQWAQRLVSTADLAGAVCQQLGVPAADVVRIRQAAQLHDVGKVGIPDEILRKPVRLTPQEWAFIRQAPAIGERITLSAPALAPVAPLVRSAREHYDGTGYPDGLAGIEIPLGARIISACAAVAAMTSDRPYADRLDTATAIGVLNQTAGTQFDPDVVAALRQVMLQPVSS
ncbi:HD domain-containing phosphohydrolase [Actinoplanes sp. NPDC051633]|uniref:HD domain-containing phosphohydrolase n=1 Tax=Actinoplanes sp. NPDC051633 TaxID=3155670 RepID=UPI003417D6EB